MSNRQFIDLFEDFDNQLADLSNGIKVALNTEHSPIAKKVRTGKKGNTFAIGGGVVSVFSR